MGQDVFPVAVKAGAYPSGDLFLILDHKCGLSQKWGS